MNRWGLAAVGLVVGAPAPLAAATEAGGGRAFAVAAAVVLVQAAALASGAHRPVAAAVAVAVPAAAAGVLLAPYAASLGAVLVALAWLARCRPWPVAVAGLGLLVLAAPANVLLGGLAQVLFALVAAALAWALGTLARSVRDRGAARRELERAEERAEVAREVHDVLAHSLTIVALHTAAARDVFDTHPDDARRSLITADDVTRSALADLRRVLASLRALGEPSAGAVHGPDDLVELARGVRDTGLPVEVGWDGPTGLDPASATAVHRIAREGLTNVVRHAGAGRARVRVQVTPDDVRVVVEDDGVGPGDRPGHGHGLAGIRERATATGGSARVGLSELGGFLVEAVVARDPAR